MPTATELAGAALPKTFKPDGKSVVSFLKGGHAPQRDYFYWELHEGKAILSSDAATDGLEAVAKDLDRTILRLLATGLKDETIARRLGMSLRTTRKHIAERVI